MTPARARLALTSAGVACALLVPIQFGWVPFIRYAWAFDLWQYLPRSAAIGLALGLGLLCVTPTRALLVRGIAAAQLRLRARALPLGWMLLLSAPLLFWVLRERQFHGDARLLMYNAAMGSEFIFPDVGATFLFRSANRLSRALGFPNLDYSIPQALLCVFAAIAVACFWRVCRHLAPSAGRAALALALILGGGLLRVLCAHIEVYAFLLACAGAYLWAALAYLAGRCHYRVPALALGVACWMHLSFIFLIPSLVVLPILAYPGRGLRERFGTWAVGLAAGAAPYLIFLSAMLALGHRGDIEHAALKMLDWVGIAPAEQHFEALLRLWWRPAGTGTRYVIYSPRHLEYLVNAFFVLAPPAIPLLVAFALFAPRRVLATPQTVFLAIACASMFVYTSLVRPYWGPHDWDLFSLTAVCFASLAAALFVNELEDPPRAQLGVLLAGASLLLVAIPLIWIGIAPAHAAGPFAIEIPAPLPGETLTEAFERTLGDWL